jgi:subtilisin family serine protease
LGRRALVFSTSLLWTFWACAVPNLQFVPGRLLVKPKPGLSTLGVDAKFRGYGALNHRALAHLNVHIITMADERVEAALEALRNDPDIEYAERDGLARAAYVTNTTPIVSGPEWHLAKIQAPQAWTVCAGRANTIVAVLDSGVNAAHPDLAGRVLPGYNFVANTTDTTDDFGHGTAVAGVVVAAGNNSLGVAGVSYGCMLLPVKVVDATGFAAYSAIAEGIHYAVDHGARVINISIAGNAASTTLQNALNYAWSNNVVVVAAAGNNANDLPQYPAACDHAVAVSATETNDTLAAFSSYGGFVALAAPGDNIWTTQRDLTNPYGPWSGTSFSSPIAAGTAALVASVNPSLSNTQIVSLLERSADDVGRAGYDILFGYGRVNASRAVSTAYNLPPVLEPLQGVGTPSIIVSWNAIPGRTYRLQYNTALNTTNWITSGADVTAGDTLVSRTDDPVAAAPQRFYRVLLLP